jgi:beta-glucosidase
MQNSIFPKNFLFGAGICDYQHFGGSTCDLPMIQAAKHFVHYQNDFRLLSELRLNAFRTSIEWARIEPEEGKINENSVKFYHKYFSRLKKTGVTTIVTLHHFTNPKWIHKYGGWLSQKTLKKFLKFVDFVSEEFDDSIDYYITINEPTIYTKLAYMARAGGLPPYHKNSKEAKQCLRNMNEVIQETYEIIHEKNKKAMVGVAQDCSVLPLTLQDRRGLLPWLLNKIPITVAIDNQTEKWKGKYDFCGINYYSRAFLGKQQVYPEGLRKICRQLYRKFRKPILITENGLSNRDDTQKTAFLVQHLKSVVNAIEHDRTEIIGYCWWSFLHGYEWGFGYKPFFALVDVDIDGSYKRTPTKTALVYSKIIQNHGSLLDLYKKFGTLKAATKFEDWL